MTKCSKCEVEVVDCVCPDIDARLKHSAFDPKGVVAFKWCRTCDKHYARCKCAIPAFYAVYRGQEFDANKYRNLLGQKVVPDLTKR